MFSSLAAAPLSRSDFCSFAFASFLIHSFYSPGVALSGNKSHPALNAHGKVSEHHVMVYTADAVQNHPEVGLTREGMILFALLAGGDYNKVCYSYHFNHDLCLEEVFRILGRKQVRSGYRSCLGALRLWRATTGRF